MREIYCALLVNARELYFNNMVTLVQAQSQIICDLNKIRNKIFKKSTAGLNRERIQILVCHKVSIKKIIATTDTVQSAKCGAVCLEAS